MKKIYIRKVPMIARSQKYFWPTVIYEHDGLNYVLVNTFTLEQKDLADDLVKLIESYPDNKAIALKECPYGQECYRVYASHYNN